MRLFLTFVCLCASAGLSLAADSTPLDLLTGDLIGHFSNREQALGDQNFRDVSLHVTRIWPGRTDGPWLYAEQALTDAPDHPYRQRVFQLAERPDGALTVAIYELANPIALTGAWREPALFEKLEPKDLVAQEGCTWVLRLQANHSFKGGTEGQGCASALRGATYSTCEAEIVAQQNIVWDRGYNATGVQVWGSVHGGYIFKRVE